MQLHDCSYRRVTVDDASGASRLICGLAQQILGSEIDAECQIAESVCANCGRTSRPTAAAPNSVVASVVWSISDRVLNRGRRAGDDSGRAWQAQRYVLPALAEDRDANRPISAESVAMEPGEPRKPGEQITRWLKHRESSSCVEALQVNDPQPGRSGRCRARVGLVGYNTASGLGYLTRDLAIQEVADRWLVAPHPRFPALNLPATRCQIDIAPKAPSPKKLAQWLRTLDWVLFAEWSHYVDLPRLAKQAGVRVALIPMWEFMSPCAEWLRCVDLLICPTQHSFDMFLEWRSRFGFTWDVRCVPWPVETGSFRFRQRRKCERFVFINGTGGVPACRLDGTERPMRRKGLDVVLGAAQVAPEIPWIVYSQTNDLARWPGNVLVKPPPADHADLYDDGDVCVQPSRWEGLGLQLLECQAAGMPLVTTDAPPMNEYHPLRLIQPHRREWGFVHDAQPIHLPMVDSWSLAEVLRELYGTDLGAASIAARTFVESHHNWDRAAGELRRLFETGICEGRA
jgi:glycosyltransferase involved in cell wall biosynthesis